MAPLRGWAPRGHRLTAKVPHGRWKTTTFLALAPGFDVGLENLRGFAPTNHDASCPVYDGTVSFTCSCGAVR